MNIKPSPLFSSPSAYTLFFLRISLYNLLTRVLCHRFYPRPNSTEAPLKSVARELVHKKCDGNNRTRVVFPAWKYEEILLYHFGFNNKWPHSYSVIVQNIKNCMCFDGFMFFLCSLYYCQPFIIFQAVMYLFGFCINIQAQNLQLETRIIPAESRIINCSVFSIVVWEP